MLLSKYLHKQNIKRLFPQIILIASHIHLVNSNKTSRKEGGANNPLNPQPVTFCHCNNTDFSPHIKGMNAYILSLPDTIKLSFMASI